MTDDTTASQLKLDPDLVDNVARGSCVLFFGADHPPATPGPPTRGQLAAALAERYPDQVDPGQSLAEAAQQFISRQNGNRNALDPLSCRIVSRRRQPGSRPSCTGPSSPWASTRW